MPCRRRSKVGGGARSIPASRTSMRDPAPCPSAVVPPWVALDVRRRGELARWYDDGCRRRLAVHRSRSVLTGRRQDAAFGAGGTDADPVAPDASSVTTTPMTQRLLRFLMVLNQSLLRADPPSLRDDLLRRLRAVSRVMKA